MALPSVLPSHGGLHCLPGALFLTEHSSHYIDSATVDQESFFYNAIASPYSSLDDIAVFRCVDKCIHIRSPFQSSSKILNLQPFCLQNLLALLFLPDKVVQGNRKAMGKGELTPHGGAEEAKS